MHREASYHARNIILAFLCAVFLGLLFGSVSWTLVVFLTSYLGWTLFQSFRLYHWLIKDQANPPPDSRGFWGDILDSIHRLQRDHQKSRDRQQAMINRIQESTNALKDAVIMTNSQGAMDWWNEASQQMLGFRQPVDRGQLIYNLIRTPSFKTYFMSKDYKMPLIINSPLNPDLKIQIQITLFGEDDRLIMCQNITRLVRLEEMRTDFVSNVSHELRTPLTVITGYLETLEDSAELPARWKRPLIQMQLQSRRMEALINDLLLLSKIENEGQVFEEESVNIEELLKIICDDAKSLNADKQHKIQLSVECNLQLKGNKTQLQSAFSNILLNAVKYTPQHGTIHIRWYQGDNDTCFSVRDSGIGIDPIHIPRLTERFYRADPSRAPETGGTGLGLAIVKHVLINHESSLEIQSELGKGSIFICHFPPERILSKEPETFDSEGEPFRQISQGG